MSVKKKQYLNFSAIGFSLIFLFNPNVAIIDVLPDFIGYIFLCLSLIRLADINDSISEAMGIFKKMIFVDAAKLIAILWIFGMSVTSEQNSSMLLWSFTFGVLEIIFLIPAFTKLFKGIAELGYLNGNTYVTGKSGRTSYTDKIKRLTVAFVFVKAVLSFLPELSDITSPTYYENSGGINLYRYIGIMRFLAFVSVLIIGIIWIFKCIAYFKRLDSDCEFVNSLEGIYAERVLPKKGIFVRRNIAVAFTVLMTAIFFSFDFRLENVNMLPDFISGLLFIAFFAVVSKKIDVNKKTAITVSAIYVSASLLAYLSELYFFEKYYYAAIYRSDEAMFAFTVKVITGCLSTVLFVFVSLLVIKALREIINNYTGVICVSDDENEAQRKMNADIKAELGKNLTYCAAATVVYAVTDIVYLLFAKDYGFMFFINVIGAVLYALSFVKAYTEISEAIKSRYLLE